MNSIQKKCFNLLLEIDDICKKNGIKYFLDPETAAKAIMYKGFKNKNDYHLGIIMSIKDGMKFIDACKKNCGADREIEYMGNSGRYPAFSISYINRNSTYIDLNEGTNYKRKGVRVEINFIRYYKKNLLCSMLESGWEFNEYHYFEHKSIKNVIAFMFVRCLMVLGRGNIAKIVFHILSRFYGNKKNSKVFIRQFKDKRKVYNESLFQQYKTNTFEGHAFLIPRTTNAYLTKFIGQDWRKKVKNLYKKNKKNIIYLDEIPYEEYLSALEKQAPFNKTVLYIKKNLMFRRLFRSELKYKERAWIIAKRSGERLELYEKLVQKKDQIDKLYKKKDYKALDKIFSEYKKRAKYYLKYNLSLCPSEEYLMILCECLDNSGEYKMAEQLIKFMPEKHRKPLNRSVIR